VLFGEDLIVWLVLALGAAMAVGNLLALLRPVSSPHREGDLERAPLLRSIVFIVVGLVAALWALASLIQG